MNQKTKTNCYYRAYNKKILLPLVFVILLASFANAAYIDLPSQVPAKIAFLFSVNLPESSSFTHSQVFYDNKLIVTAYSDDSVDIDSSNGKFVLKAFTIAGECSTLYISYIENSIGTHTVKVHSYNDTELIEETNESFEVTSEFSSGSEEIDLLLSQVNSLENDLNSLQSELGSLNSNFGSLETSTQQTVEEKTQQLKNDLQNALNEINSMKTLLEGTNKTGTISIIQQNVLQGRLDSLENETNTLTSELDATKEKLETQKDKLLSLITEDETSFTTGFFSLATQGAPVLAIIFIAVILAAFVYIKKTKVNPFG